MKIYIKNYLRNEQVKRHDPEVSTDSHVWNIGRLQNRILEAKRLNNSTG